MKIFIAFFVGLTVAVLFGFTAEDDTWSQNLRRGGEQTGIYTSTFSGITSEGAC